MTDYTELDAAIIQAIRERFVRFSEINARVRPIAAKLHFKGPHHDFRLVDRRLQAMRKRDTIRCLGAKWYVNDAALDTRADEK